MLLGPAPMDRCYLVRCRLVRWWSMPFCGVGNSQPTAMRRGSTQTRWLLVVAAAVTIAALRVLTAGGSPLMVSIMPEAVIVPGAPPAIPWPSQGEATVLVEGAGSLGSIGGEAPMPIASVAKVMTASLILRDHPLKGNQPGLILSITPAEVATTTADEQLGKSVIPLVSGEQLSEFQALEALLLPSADNIAIDLSVADAGSETKFVAEMNSEAQVLGMNHTLYTDPSGYDPATVSTASDQVLMAQAALQVPTLAQIVSMRSANLPVVGNVSNYNALLGTGGVIGVKTGSTESAGGCLLFAATKSIAGRPVTVVGAVLGQGNPANGAGSIISAALDASSRLMATTFTALQSVTGLPAGTPVVEAIGPDGAHVAGIIRSAIHTTMAPGVPVSLSLALLGNPSVARGANAGTVSTGIAGNVSNGMAGERVGVTWVGSLPGPSIAWRIDHIL